MKKRFIALLLVVVLMITVLVGYKNEPEESEIDSVNESIQNVEVEKVEALDLKKVFVSTQWVKSVIDGEQQESKKYVIIEASWGTVDDSPDYNKCHISGATHVDIII